MWTYACTFGDLSCVPSGANIVLEPIRLTGQSGLSELLQNVTTAWLPRARQVGDVLGAVTPLRSLANLVGGVAMLVSEPIRHYYEEEEGGTLTACVCVYFWVGVSVWAALVTLVLHLTPFFFFFFLKNAS